MLAKYLTPLKVFVMSEVDEAHDGVVPSEFLKQEFATLMGLTLRIGDLVATRDEILDSIRQKIVSQGVAPEDRILATTIYSDVMKKNNPEAVHLSIELIRSLDRKLRAHGGETMAWLDSDRPTAGLPASEMLMLYRLKRL
jgi:hypothetical protein